MDRVQHINEHCAEFIQHQVPEVLARQTWLKRWGRLHLVSFDEVKQLAALSNTHPADLILKHGFGSYKITIDELRQYVDDQNDGLELSVTERYEAA